MVGVAVIVICVVVVVVVVFVVVVALIVGNWDVPENGENEWRKLMRAASQHNLLFVYRESITSIYFLPSASSHMRAIYFPAVTKWNENCHFRLFFFFLLHIFEWLRILALPSVLRNKQKKHWRPEHDVINEFRGIFSKSRNPPLPPNPIKMLQKIVSLVYFCHFW